MRSIGILVNNTMHGQLAFYAIQKSNDYLKKNRDCDLIIFQEDISPLSYQPNFAIQPILKVHGFKGIAIATDLTTALKLSKTLGPSRKIFFSYDLYWTRFSPKLPYEQLAQIYQDKSLEIAARSESHRDIISKVWNRDDTFVLDEFNFDRLYK